MERICIEDRELVLIIVGLVLNFAYHTLSNHHSMQEAISTCISVCSVIVIIVSTILVLLLSILLVLVKNTVLTKEF